MNIRHPDPTMRKRIVVIGGGGLGREIVRYLMDDMKSGRLPDGSLAGVVDPDPNCQVAKYLPECSYLGPSNRLDNPEQYQYVIAIGAPSVRQRIAFELHGLAHFTYIHQTALVASDATIGDGTFVGPGSIINSGVTIGKCCSVNVLCSVGHGAIIGDYSVLSPYAALSGDSKIGKSCFLGTRATIFPCLTVGDSCIVDSHSFVKNDIGDRKIVSARGRYDVLENRMANGTE
jgi:sugar O-acyltransferase (sialic acid O-acetyltransferase NeuD family)